MEAVLDLVAFVTEGEKAELSLIQLISILQNPLPPSYLLLLLFNCCAKCLPKWDE